MIIDISLLAQKILNKRYIKPKNKRHVRLFMSNKDNIFRNIHPMWKEIARSLRRSFWMHKGLSGECPFCHAQSEPGKERFLIRFSSNGSFLGYNCFICTKWGKGSRGIKDLVTNLGLKISFFDINSMASNDDSLGGHNKTKSIENNLDDEDDLSPIYWPPPWINETDDIFLEGFNYLEKRGILNIANKIDMYGLKFSTVIDQKNSGSNLRKYPCILAPFAKATDNEVWGWTSRRLNDVGRPSNEPKSIAKSGRGWKSTSMFGVRELDINKPIVIVEGLFSSLSTPNSVAIGGKQISEAQLNELASLESGLYIFALDPDVKPSVYANSIYQLRQKVPGTKVLNVNWEYYGGVERGDPNDRGEEEMKKIIVDTMKGKY